ncbi:MAG: MATE family efflux transporter, partial [Rikenellaceae bacterium]|nr:MATE family efflux transporter [Rikenellaceae bacterium]
MSNSKSIESSYLSLEVEKISTLLLRFAIPAITSTVVLSIYNIVDRVFIGHGVGPMAISGLALTLPLMSFVTAIGTLVGAGASARVSIVLGMKDIPWVQKILGNSIVMTFALSAILVSISMIWLDEILVA